jgi:hypothetical protein
VIGKPNLLEIQHLKVACLLTVVLFNDSPTFAIKLRRHSHCKSLRSIYGLVLHFPMINLRIHKRIHIDFSSPNLS